MDYARTLSDRYPQTAGKVARDFDDYGSFAVREEQLAIDLAYAELGVRVAELEVRRHDEDCAPTVTNLKRLAHPEPSWASAHREELLVRVEEAKLQVRRQQNAINRHRAMGDQAKAKEAAGYAGAAAPAHMLEGNQVLEAADKYPSREFNGGGLS